MNLRSQVRVVSKPIFDETTDKYKKLWSHVLLFAFRDLKWSVRPTPKCITQKRIENKKFLLRKELYVFFNKESTLPLICEHLDLDINSVRKRVNKIFEQRKETS